MKNRVSRPAPWNLPTENKSPVDGATDANTYTAAHIRKSDATGRSWFNVVVPSPRPLLSIFLKASINKHAFMKVTVRTDTGVDIVLRESLTTTSGDAINIPVNVTAIITSIHLDVTTQTMPASSHKALLGHCYGGDGECLDFTVSEIAGTPRTNLGCYDDITLDLGSIRYVKVVRIHMYSQAVKHLFITTSIDGTHYTSHGKVLFDPTYWQVRLSSEV